MNTIERKPGDTRVGAGPLALGADWQPTPITLTTCDRLPLAATLFEPKQPAKLTVLVTTGIGVPQRLFRHIAAWFASRNLRCMTFDYRGFGESATSAKAVSTASLSAWAEKDAVAAFEYAERTWAEPVVLLGHSFGGQLLGLAEPLHRVRSAVLVASQFGSAHHWDGWDRFKISAYWWLILPLAAKYYTIVPKWLGLGAFVPSGVAREWADWGRRKDWYLSFKYESSLLLKTFHSPMLAYEIEDDIIAPPRAVSALLERFNPALVERRHLSPRDLALSEIGHYGLFRPAPQNPFGWKCSTSFVNAAGCITHPVRASIAGGRRSRFGIRRRER